MAKKNAPVVADDNLSTNDNVDDLLDSASENTGSASDALAKAKEEAKAKAAEAKAEIEKIKAKAKADAAELKAKAKEEAKALKEKAKEDKKPRENKGVNVSFTNKAGELIEGKGVLYYVVRSGGKLHYKEASQVTVIGDVDADVPVPAKA